MPRNFDESSFCEQLTYKRQCEATFSKFFLFLSPKKNDSHVDFRKKTHCYYKTFDLENSNMEEKVVHTLFHKLGQRLGWKQLLTSKVYDSLIRSSRAYTMLLED